MPNDPHTESALQLQKLHEAYNALRATHRAVTAGVESDYAAISQATLVAQMAMLYAQSLTSDVIVLRELATPLNNLTALVEDFYEHA